MLMKAVEARKKAEVVYVHINKLENAHTHSALPKKSQSHYCPDGFLLSLLSLHSSTPFIPPDPLHTLLASQKILALKHFSF